MYVYKTFHSRMLAKVTDLAVIRGPWKTKCLDYDVKITPYGGFKSIEMRLWWFKRHIYCNLCHWTDNNKVTIVLWGPIKKYSKGCAG